MTTTTFYFGMVFEGHIIRVVRSPTVGTVDLVIFACLNIREFQI